MIIPPNDYFPAVRQICDKYNILMIADEVMTFGKTGKWFAMEHFNTTPDLFTIAKVTNLIGNRIIENRVFLVDTYLWELYLYQKKLRKQYSKEVN